MNREKKMGTKIKRGDRVDVQVIVLDYLEKALRKLVPKPGGPPTYNEIRDARILIQAARGELLGYYEGPVNRRRLIPPSRMPPIKT
jgi:hypothetical protein